MIVRRITLPLLLLLLSPGLLPAQPAGSPTGESPDGIWRHQDPAQETSTLIGVVLPRRFRSLALDRIALERLLEAARPEDPTVSTGPEVVLTLPLPSGDFGRFSVVESPIMASELAERYPGIRTYRGQGLDDPTATVRFDLTPRGFHAMILSSAGTVFVDPRDPANPEVYISYFGRDAHRPAADPWECHFKETEERIESAYALPEAPTLPAAAAGPELRTYRLAVAATGEYTAFHSQPDAPNVPDGLAAIVTAMNRVNAIYEREVAIRMELVASNDSIVFTNTNETLEGAPADYTNNVGFLMLSQNQQNLDALIGNANYDIGHVFSTGGGGVASLGVPCTSGSKARGVTGLGAPTGDVFWVDYVAHEMGHQWGATHTFNGDEGSCSGGNRTAGTAYEPGSGSTIMAYAGICGSQNLQFSSDDYFHTASFDQITSYSTLGQGDTCAATTATGNSAPTVEAGPAHTLPSDTPFTLCGSATDPNSDPLTYGWDEYDLGPAGHPDSPEANAPIFRSFDPQSSSCRTFPKESDLLAGTRTFGELLPSYGRDLTFRLTARDNRSAGGGVDHDQTSLVVDGGSGPFQVLAPDGGESLAGGCSFELQWDPAGTQLGPVSCPQVDLLLSTDSGATFSTTLLAMTANDGTQSVALPDVTLDSARVKVACSHNLFFDLSAADFDLVSTSGWSAGNLPLSNHVVTTAEPPYEAIGAITAGNNSVPGDNFIVADTGVAVFRSADGVVLTDGFQVEGSGTFSIELVSGTCP